MLWNYAGRTPTTMSSSYSLNSVSEGPSWSPPSPSDLQRQIEGRPSMPYWFLRWRHVLASRFTSRLRALLLWFVRVSCLGGAFLYTALSFAADYQYGMGMRTHEAVYINRAAALFPLSRDRRSGPAYLAILKHDLTAIKTIERALVHDPHAADLYFGLAGMRLNIGDQAGYNVALTQLQKLTPGVEYRIIGQGG